MHEEGILRRWDKSILPYIFNREPDEEVATHIKERSMVFNPRPKSAWVLNIQLDPLTLNYSTQLSTSRFNIQS